MWAVASWNKKDRSDALLVQNEDGTTMIFPSCGEAISFANANLNGGFLPVRLWPWKS